MQDITLARSPLQEIPAILDRLFDAALSEKDAALEEAKRGRGAAVTDALAAIGARNAAEQREREAGEQWEALLRVACGLAVGAAKAHDVLNLALHEFHQSPAIVRAARPPSPQPPTENLSSGMAGCAPSALAAIGPGACEHCTDDCCPPPEHRVMFGYLGWWHWHDGAPARATRCANRGIGGPPAPVSDPPPAKVAEPEAALEEVHELWATEALAFESALSFCRETLSMILRIAPGYDWNADIFAITLRTGETFRRIDAALAGESLRVPVADTTETER